jgi:hypothetical protein
METLEMLQPVSTPHDRITAEVTSWPDVSAATGSRGEWSFRIGRREIGHLHGNTVAHFFFAPETWLELAAAGRITYHPVFPEKVGPAARRIASDADVDDVIALLRLNYERRAGSDVDPD